MSETVQGKCPSCGGSSLFLASGGYVTCARLECSNPEAASLLLKACTPSDPLDGAIITGTDPHAGGPVDAYFVCDIAEGHDDGRWYWDVRKNEWITKQEAQRRGGDFRNVYRKVSVVDEHQTKL